MTPTLHCGECGKPTDNHSLICDGCAPEYETALPEFKRAAWRRLSRQMDADFAEWALRQAVIFAEAYNVQTNRT